VTKAWIQTVPILDNFAQLAETTGFAAMPGDWYLGVADVVDSTGAIQSGHYKAVNMAGAGVISAVANALGGDLTMFAFGGDGATFAIPAEQKGLAADALARVAMWAKRDLGLDLRVGILPVTEVRSAGFDVRVAFWKASDNAHFAMFTGGGFEWAEERLKRGEIGIEPSKADEEPDLSGLSCQWGPIFPKHGNVVSLIVKQAQGASAAQFSEVARDVLKLLEETGCQNPVGESGPEVGWPAHSLSGTALAWLVFKLKLRVGGFDPDRYRREIYENTDFRKFDDGLFMTVDCSDAVISKLSEKLEEAGKEGLIQYGLHVQGEALMTCVAPSILSSDHMHFIDGAGGGYALAAQQLKERERDVT
jgi:hypothetical protein